MDPVGNDAPGSQAARRSLRRWRHDRRLLSILDASADGVLGLDSRGRVSIVNAATTRMLGWTAEAVLGEPGDTVVPGLSGRLEALWQRTRSARRDGPSGPGVDVVARTSDGLGIPVTLWLTSLRTRRPAVAVATLRDLRDYLAAEDLVARLESERNDERAVTSAVLGSLTDRIVLVTDLHGRITRTNRAAERMLGYSAAELSGTQLRDLGTAPAAGSARDRRAPQPFDGPADPLIEQARCGLPSRQDRTLLTKDGDRRRVSISVTPVTSLAGRESTGGFVCIVIDREQDAPAAGDQRPPAQRACPPVVVDVTHTGAPAVPRRDGQ